MSALHEEKLQRYIDESETKHQMEMDEIEERKSMQIMKLIEEHEQSYAEMRNYYNDITQNNLTLISSLKEQMEELRGQLEKSEGTLAKVNILHPIDFITHFTFILYLGCITETYVFVVATISA